MNQQPPNQVPQGVQGQQQPMRLLRPENMRTIPHLSAVERQRYEEGLQGLYNKVEQLPADSPDHQDAKRKIVEFSRMVMNKIKSIHAQAQAQAQGHAQTQVQTQMQTQGPTQTQGSAATAPKPNIPLNRPQPPPVETNSTSTPTPTIATAATAQPAAAPIPRHILDYVNKLPWSQFPIAAHYTPEQTQKIIADAKNKSVRALIHMEMARNRTAKIEALLKDRQEKGIPIGQEEMNKFQAQRAADKKSHAEADAYIKSVRAQMSAGQASGQMNGSQLQGAGQQGRPQLMQQGNTGGGASTPAMQVPTTSINAAIDAAKTTQIAAANRANSVGGTHQPQQPQQPQAQPAQSNPPQAQTPVTPATPTIATGQPSHPTPAPAQAQVQAQVKIEPGASAQHLPPVNTAIAAPSSAHIQSAGTPTQAPTRVQTPQSAQPPTGGNVRPLTHAAAVIRANSSSNITGQPTNSSSSIANTTPSLPGMTPQPGHSHAHPQPAPSLTSKMPIPKTLHEKAIAPPQPVAVGGGNTPGRPTYGGGNGAGGVMNQPVIAKMPVPQFDTEGDHVLSKKKLDELVRQVCGGGSPGADGNYLTPDVEESVLSVADNFVDDVLHMACRLAKERGSKVLEIRDIQLVLERVFNIRIPGYTSDELRTVRKVQPSPNWIAKMSAIQAAKVTSGKDDK
ncbi:hypothetical protein GGR51DRAFT_560924 [Nemania sp. FL0031]|nr:hypothetical protein GGR51DRAFT_560924 [Nemania sp. FL0031]